jgi:hypothetical protein
LQLYDARANYPFFSQELPLLTKVLSRLGIRLYPRWVDGANRELQEWNSRLCAATLADDVALAANGASSNPADEAVVTRSMLAGIEKEKEAGTESILYPTAILQQDLTVASELFDHLLAGQETAGITLTYLIWHLSKDQDLQRSLHAELMTLEPSMRLPRGETRENGDGDEKGAMVPDPKALDSLQVLNAVLMETLRLNAAIPGPQPREAPFPSCRLGPYEVPGGTRVAALAHTLHRDERVFPEPEKWDHARWVMESTDEESRKARNRQFWAFSSGGRMCLGSNFAIHGLLPPFRRKSSLPSRIVGCPH